jgi:hypothetical protein
MNRNLDIILSMGRTGVDADEYRESFGSGGIQGPLNILSRNCLALRRNTILKIENEAVSIGLPRLLYLLGLIARDEEQRP